MILRTGTFKGYIVPQCHAMNQHTFVPTIGNNKRAPRIIVQIGVLGQRDINGAYASEWGVAAVSLAAPT